MGFRPTANPIPGRSSSSCTIPACAPEQGIAFVDGLFGTSYDVVKAVYERISDLTAIANYLDNAVISDDITEIVRLTQAEFDLLAPPVSTILYLISEEE